MAEKVSHLVEALPKEVVEFIAECRRESYSLEGQSNHTTGNPYDIGFRFVRDGMEFVDVSSEQNGQYFGTEYVSVIGSANPILNGKKFYAISYFGKDEPDAENVGKELVAAAQHSLVIAHPTLVRFGAQSFWLETSVGGKNFTYHEDGREINFEWNNRTPWGHSNIEMLYENVGFNTRVNRNLTPLHKSASQVMIFNI